MKTMKKFLSVVLAISVVMAFSITSFAASNGTITIQNASEGATYNAYKIFDCTYSGTAPNQNVSYTYTASVADPAAATGGDALYKALTDTTSTPASPFTLTATGSKDNGKPVYAVSVDSSLTAATIATFLKGLLAKSPCPLPTPVSKTCTGDNTVVFSSLPEGYYLVTSTVNKGTGDFGTAVSLDTTTPNVIIKDKNQMPTWGNPPNDPADPTNPKDPTDPAAGSGKSIVLSDGTRAKVSDAKVGDTVTFEIAIDASAYAGEDLVSYYYIKDELGTGFSDATITSVVAYPYDINTSGQRIYKKKTDGTLDKTTLSESTTSKKGTYVNTDVSGTTDSNANGFNLRIPFGLQYGTDAKIVVTYTATLTKDAAIGDAANENKANFTWETVSYDPNNPTFDPEDPDDTSVGNFPTPDTSGPDYTGKPPQSTYTTTYAVGFEKTDGTKALTGAEFSFPKNLIKNADGVYTLAPTDYSGTDLVKAGDPLVLSNDSGLLIKGLAPGTYEITEIKAPAGFEVKQTPISFTIASKYDSTTKKNIYDAANCLPKGVDSSGNATTNAVIGTTFGAQAVEGEFVNDPAKELPATGGIGTKIFYVFGTILALGAAIVLITRRRMNAR